MAPTNECLNPIPTKTISKSIVQLHRVVNQKQAVPDRLWQSIKHWKSELNYWEQEGNYLRKILSWNQPTTNSARRKLICNHFDKMMQKDLPQFIEAINEIEKEIVSSMMDNEQEIKISLEKIQKLEKELNAFKTKITPIKLEVLKEISKVSPIIFI